MVWRRLGRSPRFSQVEAPKIAELGNRIGVVMDFPASAFPATNLSRRQFGMVVSGGALLLAAGGTYGVIANSARSAGSSVSTAFGKISVIRAGRFARLDEQGRIASGALAKAASHLGGLDTGTTRSVRLTESTTTVDDHGHGGAPQNQAWPQPVNLTWGDVLVVEAEIVNARPGPVLFTPAQLRLKLLPSGTTVTPQDSDHAPGSLEGKARERILISYLAPHSLTDFELEFSDGAQDNPLRLALPPLTATEVFS